MKLKTFILTFLMMSCSIVFGQGTYSESAKTEAQIMMHLANDEVGTITIANNISIGNTIEISNGRKVTIDLNGHELSTNEEIYIFKNFGKLTITDSDPEGKGTIIAPLGIYNGKPQTRTISTDINYNAQLTINGGKFVSTSSNVSAAIYNHLGVINIRGGEFYGEYSAITNYGMANIENTYIECLNRDNGAAAIINDFEIEYGENVRIVGRYTTATETGVITPSDYEPTYLFAELNGTKYPSLQAALDACTTGNNTINLLFHNSDNATVSQKEGVNITIVGNGYKNKQFEYTGTIYVNGNNRYTGNETLTIQNVNFTTNEADHDFISANVAKEYAHNLTVRDCNFTATGAGEYTAVAMRFRQAYNIKVEGGIFTKLHSVMWATGGGGDGITVENIAAEDCKNGVSFGTSTPVAVKNSTIDAEIYAVRADGSGAYNLTVANSTLEAEVPVIVRKTTGEEYNLTVAEDVTLTATNGGPQVVVTKDSDDVPYVAPTVKVNVTLNNDASTFGLVAKIGNKYYSTLDEAFAVATEDQTIVLLADATPVLTSQRAITKAAVIDLNDKTLTLAEDDLYFGTTTFKNGNIVVDPSVKASTAVFWMFENQTLTFDNVKLTATGVTGTYLIGINGGTGSNVNLLNGTNIIINNESQVALETAVICDNGTGNNVIIKDSYINVKNIEGRFYLGGTSGNITVDNTDIDLNGVKEGFYLRANQTLSIEGESEVEVVLNDTNNRYGINITDYSATYTKDDLATVNATVYDPVVRVKNLTELQTALVENVDKPIFATETIVISEGTLELDLNTRRVFAADKNVIRNDGATLTIKNGTIERVGDVVGYAFNNAQGALNITGTTIKGGLYTSGTSLVATNANISHFQSSRHAIYAYNCNVTLNGGTYHNDNSGNATIMAAGSSVVTIKDGTFSIKDGRQELGWTSCLTDTQNTASITVEGGTFNGGFRVQDGTTMTIEGGSFNDCYGSGYNIYGTAVVKGGTFTDANAINFAKGNLAVGYVASDNGNGTFTVLKGVANIGDTYYATLQAAINAVQDGETVTLVNDITYTDYVYASGKTTAVNIANGKNFTLNLNGKSITGTNATENNYELVTIAKGTKLTIEDSSADKTGKISYTGTRETNDGWMHRCHTIFNQGTLVLNGGTIENNTPATAEAVASAIDNNASWGNEGYLTVNGGTVISTSYYAVRTDVNTHNTNANSTLKAQTTFNDGIVYGFYLMDRGSDIAQWPSNAIEFAVGDNATIKPCEYNGQALRFRVNTKSAYDLTVSENATIEGTIKGAVTVVGNKYYAYLQDAIDACVAGDNIITLREDVTEDVTIIQKEGVNVVIDGAKDAENKYTFTGLMSVDGNARHNGEETLTIKNINFVAKEGANACITAAKGSANYCYSHNLTVENCTFTDPDDVVDCAAIRQPSGIGGGCVNWTVKNCSVDETMHSLMNTSNINNLVVEGCIVKSKSGLNLNNSGNVTLEDNNFDVQTYALRAGENGGTPAANKYVLKNNTMKSACDGGDAVIIFRNTASAADFSMTENVVSGTIHISGHTAATQLAIDANYWDGEENPVADPAIRVNSYYADAELQNLVHNYHGDNFIGYTDEFKIWGEVWGNAFETFVIKVLDKNGEVMGTTSLNDVDGFIDGDVTATWSLLFDVASNSDPYWTMSWETRPTVANMPASVELYVDGHKVGEGPVQLNNPDNLEKKTVAIVDNDGYIKVFYASFDQAYKASKTGDVLELLETAVITKTSSWVNYSARQITVNARNINPAFRVQDNAYVWFGGMTINSYDGYCIIVGAEDASSGADVEIYGGTYNGETTAISVTKGDLQILGGTFQVEPYEGSYEYTINCIDAAYNNNDADVSIQGGKFYNFNPQDNAAEGIGTNFLTGNYAAVVDADGWYTVGKAYAQIDNKYYATLKDAINAATDGQTVKLTRDITEDVNISKLEKSITIDGDDYDNKYKKMKGLSIGSDDNNLDAGVVTIKNIAFNGKGLSVKELANVTIQNNTFTNITEGNAITVICDNLTEKVNVSANTITNVEAGTGIRIRNAKEAAVTGNKVSEIFNNAILLEGNTTGDIAVTDNVLSNWGKDVEEKGRAIRIVKGENTSATITGNAMLHDNAPEQFVKISGNTENVNVNENYWNGQNPFAEELFTDDNNYNAYPQSYYAKYDAATNELSELVTISYVAKIGKVQYTSLAEAATAAQDGETIQLLWNEGDAAIAMAATFVGNKTVTISGTADVDWDKGWLYVGRNGEGNGKLIFKEANLTSKSVGVNNNGLGLNVSCKKEGESTTNDGEVEIINSNIQLDYLIGKGNIKLDNSTLNVYEGFAVGARPASETGEVQRTVTMDITNGSNVIVKNHNGQGLGYESMGIMNIDATSSFETTQAFLITADGTMNNAGTVTINGTLTNNGAINFTNDAATLKAQEGLTINYDLNADKKVVYVDGVYKVVEKVYVAQIGDVKFESLQEAIDAATNDATIVLIESIEQADGVIIDSKNIVVDLNEETFTVTEGANTNNRNFKIIGTSVVTIKNGTMVAAGDYSSGAYGTVRTEGEANVTLTGLKLYNYRGNGLNIKALGGTTVAIDNTEIYSQYGGGIEAAGGTITLAETVKVEQKGMYTAPYNSMAISVNGGGTVTVAGGTYSTECITAEEANNQGSSHGPWVVGVLNSGGTLIINGGTFSNDNFGDNSLATYARGAVLADTGAEIEINGGTFNALKAIIDMTNNLGDANNNPSALLSGGTFSADPRISGLYASHLIVVAQGYIVVENEDGTYSVVEDQVAKIGDVTYKLLQEAFDAAQDGDEIVVLKDITYTKANGYVNVNSDYIDGLVYTGDKSFTVDFGGYTITDNGEINDYLVYLKNQGEKENEITFKNGTIAIKAERTNTAWAAITVGANSATYKTTLNLNDMEVVNGNPNEANNQVIRTRNGATVNLNNETVVTSNGTSYGVVAETGSTVNINSGAKVVQQESGTTGGDEVYTAVSGNGTINIYDGATIESDRYAIHNMTTGNTVINIYGGTITAPVAVHVATNGGNGESAVAYISGGTFTGSLETYTGAASIVITGGIFSEEPSEDFIAESYGAFPYDENSWVVRQISGEQTFELTADWNWVSSYITEFNGTTGLAMLQNGLGTYGIQIKNDDYTSTYRNNNWSGRLESVSVEEMYKVNMNGDVNFKFEGGFVNYDECKIVLYPGWNYIGYPVNVETNLADALVILSVDGQEESNGAKEGDVIKSQIESATYIGSSTWFFSNQFNLVPGEGYMYYNTSDEVKFLRYTTKKATTTSETNTRSNNHWTVDATQYPSNMTMIAMTDVEGGNYEVAAFVNGEVRGSSRPVYVESLDAYIIILTISGDDVEEMTFKCYDLTTGEEVEFSNRINYSNDAIVGSIYEPYMLTRGTTGIGEAAMSNVNIYPNPTTTGTEINLQATCDKVEVFNALGVKVVEYQNVDSIDALETAGIYVIRITNNGNVQNCRLVVK